jgi:CheY-like chemotaxis protein
VVVVDCEYNMAGMDPLDVYNRTIALVESLRTRRPDIPVILLEGHEAGQEWLLPSVRLEHNRTKEAYRRAYEAPPPFVKSDVIVNIAVCSACALCQCEFNTSCQHE